MKELYKSPYARITFDESRSLLEFVYTPETQYMTTETYKAEVARYFEALGEYRPLRMLSDLREFYYSIVPEVQDWINTTLVPKMPYIVGARSAMVMSTDFVTQVSIEQTVEDSLKATPQPAKDAGVPQYFATREEAIAWLLS